MVINAHEYDMLVEDLKKENLYEEWKEIYKLNSDDPERLEKMLQVVGKLGDQEYRHRYADAVILGHLLGLNPSYIGAVNTFEGIHKWYA